jgi:hypothetical protein
MRRIVGSLILLPILAALLAGPVAAAPPIHDSGTQDGMTVFHSSCGPSLCTDTIVDGFTISDDVVVVCVSQFTFNIHSGRLISEDSGCSETTADALVVSDDLSSASLAATAVTFLNCDQQGCVEGDTVTVAAELTGFGTTFANKQRFTFTDGTCTFKQTFSGESRQATGTLTLDGETTAADGNISTGKFSFSEHCR